MPHFFTYHLIVLVSGVLCVWCVEGTKQRHTLFFSLYSINNSKVVGGLGNISVREVQERKCSSLY